MKYFKFNKELKGTQMRMQIGDELKIKIIDGIEYIMDGCFTIFELDSDMAKEYGELVDRLW